LLHPVGSSILLYLIDDARTNKNQENEYFNYGTWGLTQPTIHWVPALFQGGKPAGELRRPPIPF